MEGGGQAQGLPLRVLGGVMRRLGGRKRAGTRPAPTGSFWGRWGVLVDGGGQAQGLPLPVPSFWGRWGVLGDGRGQAQGLPLRVLFGGDGASWWTGEGRHKACPYGFSLGRWSGLGGRGRAGTRPAPTFCLKVIFVQATLFWMVMDHFGERGVRFEKSFELWLPSVLTPAGQFTTQISTKVPEEAGPPKGEKPHLPVGLPQPEHLVLRGPLKATCTQTLASGRCCFCHGSGLRRRSADRCRGSCRC